jgi:hypothetical protein
MMAPSLLKFWSIHDSQLNLQSELRGIYIGTVNKQVIKLELVRFSPVKIAANVQMRTKALHAPH